MFCLADFGLSKVDDQEKDDISDYAETMCGTKLYMAPEVFQRHYNEKADVFSMGLVLYVMITRCTSQWRGKQLFGVMIDDILF